MRIISWFNDYYDWLQSISYADYVVYDRYNKCEYLEGKNKINSVSQSKFLLDRVFTNEMKMLKYIILQGYRRGIIGFCGQIFPYIDLFYKDRLSNSDECIRFYSDDDKDIFLKKHSRKKQLWQTKKQPFSKLLVYAPSENERKKLSDFFKDYSAPVFHIYPAKAFKEYLDNDGWSNDLNYIEINPSLIDESFQHIYPPEKCYQELEMYLGNILLQKQEELIEISNEHKITQYGFDKHSFRKKSK